MPRRPSSGLTPLELEIMKVLWAAGSASVQEVQQSLGPTRKLAYNSVQTMLNILWRKGKVQRSRQDRAFRYVPCVSRLQAIREALRDLVHRMFEGSPEDLVMSLVETRQLTPERIERVMAVLEKRKGGPRGRP